MGPWATRLVAGNTAHGRSWSWMGFELLSQPNPFCDRMMYAGDATPGLILGNLSCPLRKPRGQTGDTATTLAQGDRKGQGCCGSLWLPVLLPAWSKKECCTANQHRPAERAEHVSTQRHLPSLTSQSPWKCISPPLLLSQKL